MADRIRRLRGIAGAKPYKEQLHTTTTQEAIITILDHLLSDERVDTTANDRDASHPLSIVRVPMKK